MYVRRVDLGWAGRERVKSACTGERTRGDACVGSGEVQGVGAKDVGERLRRGDGNWHGNCTDTVGACSVIGSRGRWCGGIGGRRRKGG